MAAAMSLDTTSSNQLLHAILSGMRRNHENFVFFRGPNGMVRHSFADVVATAGAVAGVLRDVGVVPGDRVVIHGETSYDWLLVDLACVILGAVSIAVYPNCPDSRIEAVLRECQVSVVFTSEPRLFARLSATGSAVFYLERDGGPATHPRSVRNVLTGVRAVGPDEHRAFLSPVFTIVSTSGTLAEPRFFGVAPTPLLRTIEEFARLHTISRRDRFLVFLPLSHLPQRMIVYGMLLRGIDIALSDPRTFIEDAMATSPTLTVAVPRVLEFIHTKLTGGGFDSPDACHAMFGPAMRAVFYGSAPTRRDVVDWLLRHGFDLYEVYGTTELGIIAVSHPGGRRPGYAGPLIRFVQASLDPQGELLVRTETPFLYGFMRNGRIEPDTTDPAAWRASGDIAELDDGYVRVLRRAKDFISLTSGEKVFIDRMEESLRSRLGSGAQPVVIGNGKKAIRLLVFGIGASAVEQNQVMAAAVSHNESCHLLERIRHFAMISQPLSVTDGTLTETMKVRRHRVEELFQTAVNWISV